MMKTKKQPERHCIGCHAAGEKRALIRIVRTPEGTVETDPTGKKNGRGAYLCRSADCLAKAWKSHRLERSLKCEIPQTVYDALAREVGHTPDGSDVPGGAGDSH